MPNLTILADGCRGMMARAMAISTKTYTIEQAVAMASTAFDKAEAALDG